MAQSFISKFKRNQSTWPQTTFLLLMMAVTSGVAAANSSCDRKTTAIADIQGSQATSPLVNETVWVKGLVTGDFRGKDALGGFFIQSQQAKPSQHQSVGLFIKENNQQLPLAVGDLVVIKGQVSEQSDVTQLGTVEQLETCETGVKLPAAKVIQLPINLTQLEATEGMRVTLADPHVITDVFNYLRYGELIVSPQLMMSPTAKFRPGDQAQSYAQSIKKNQLIIDDGRMNKYPKPFVSGSDGLAPVSAATAVQMGQPIKVTGVMHYAFGKYKLQPTEKIHFGQPIKSSAPVPTSPGGSFQVATFNLENFFTTLDDGKEKCGPLKDFGCRGADSKDEYDRQLAKLITVLNSADATVVGLQELENNGVASIRALVNGLNSDAGREKWAYVDTGALGEDVIKVGLIYQPDLVQPKGTFSLLNAAADPEFQENKNRIIVAQTFRDSAGNAFNVATVHFKSKSCRDATGPFLDQKDGQGCYNPTRIQVAKQLGKWLNSDPTEQGAAATFIVGDFNSYQFEDPMEALKSMGFFNLASQYLSPQNWTTSYRGTVGSLDYVLANEAAQKLATGLTQWHINSVSMKDFGYNTEPFDDRIKKPANFYRTDPYASSDHDLVMAGFAW